MEGVHQIPEGGHSIHPHLPRHRTSESWCSGVVYCKIAEKLSRTLRGPQGFAHSHALVVRFLDVNKYVSALWSVCRVKR